MDRDASGTSAAATADRCTCRSSVTRAIGASLAAALFLSVTAPARADALEDFYRNRTVSLIIGYSVGGGYDAYARTLARHMGKHLPGQPTVVAQNMEGAGTLRAANYLYSAAPKDGSTFGTIARGMGTEPLLGDAHYDALKFTWLGSITSEISLCATWYTSQVKTWDDVLTKSFTFGGAAPGADTDVFALLLRNLFGAKLKLVDGYPGGNDIDLAMERGEVEGRCGWSLSSIKSRNPLWLTERKITPLVQFGLEKSPELPDLPLIMDVASSDEQRQILRLILARQVMARPFLAPPGLPEDRKQALRTAFDQTMKDPEYLAEAAKNAMEVNPVTGAAIDALLAEVYRTPRDVIEKAKRAIRM